MSRSYEAQRNLITEIENKAGTNVISKYQYANDAIARRTQRKDSGDAIGRQAVTNDFGYNTRSELIAGLMGTNQYGYVFDNIGNRNWHTNNAEALQYGVNQLNQYTNIADGVTNSPLHDVDGNLTNDGVRAYAWNGENRLIKTESAASVPDAAKVKVENLYDYMGRRVRKTVSSDYSGGSYTTTNVTTYVWDGFNIIAEMCDAGYTNWYTWGLDLSGSLQGAGGIGGLLARTRSSDTQTVFFCYDGNGNVVQLLDASDATNVLAAYEYGPFGGVSTMSGTEATNNFLRFSTKYWDTETGLGYWGFRFYSPELGRWLSRDPIGEEGGLNLGGIGVSPQE